MKLKDVLPFALCLALTSGVTFAKKHESSKKGSDKPDRSSKEPDKKPDKPKPVKAKPEPKPVEKARKPAESKPEKPKPQERKGSESKPVAAKPANEPKPSQAKPVDSPPPQPAPKPVAAKQPEPARPAPQETRARPPEPAKLPPAPRAQPAAKAKSEPPAAAKENANVGAGAPRLAEKPSAPVSSSSTTINNKTINKSVTKTKIDNRSGPVINNDGGGGDYIGGGYGDSFGIGFHIGLEDFFPRPPQVVVVQPAETVTVVEVPTTVRVRTLSTRVKELRVKRESWSNQPPLDQDRSQYIDEIRDLNEKLTTAQDEIDTLIAKRSVTVTTADGESPSEKDAQIEQLKQDKQQLQQDVELLKTLAEMP